MVHILSYSALTRSHILSVRCSNLKEDNFRIDVHLYKNSIYDVVKIRKPNKLVNVRRADCITIVYINRLATNSSLRFILLDVDGEERNLFRE